VVPGKLGRNGDQIQRLFREDADLYLGQIDKSVLQHALARWVSTGTKVYYGIIDGADAERLRLAYPDQFVARPKKKKRTKPKSRKRR
jgi:hypothetical protein